MLEVKNLSFQYNSNRKSAAVLRNISFKIKDKELVSVIGPSGCGKTTLVRIIAGYQSPGEGEIIFQGIKISGPSKDRVVISQEDDLFPWMNVRKHLELIDSDEKRIDELLSLTQLENFQDYYPAKLSGGMKRRLSLARALAADSDFIMMDEPFSSQDIKIKTKLYNELLDIIKISGKSLLLVTHDIEEAMQLSSRIIVLAGRPAEIIAEHKVPFKELRNLDDNEDKKARIKDLKNQLANLGYNV